VDWTSDAAVYLIIYSFPNSQCRPANRSVCSHGDDRHPMVDSHVTAEQAPPTLQRRASNSAILGRDVDRVPRVLAVRLVVYGVCHNYLEMPVNVFTT
jgi:hypothetical protein